MASLTAIRTGLATRLATISGLRAFADVPDQIPVPAAVVAPPDGVDFLFFDASMGRGMDRWTLAVRLYVGKVSEMRGQQALDAYLAGSGTQSIKAAVEADKTLGGAAQTLQVRSVRGYGVYALGSEQYLGAEWLIDIWGAGA